MEKENNSKEEYNNIPIHYCKHCLSLKIKGISQLGLDYCDECNSTDIESASIKEWEEMYEKRYGFKYINSTI